MNKITKYIWAGVVMVFTSMNVHAQSSTIEVWVEDPLVKVFQDAKPNGEQQAHADVARGEHASLQIVVRSPKAIKALRCEIGPLQMQGNEQVLLKGATVRFVGYVPINKPTPYPPKVQLRRPPVNFPDPLLEQETIDVAAGSSQPVWIDVPIPVTTKPGEYSGLVQIRGIVDGREESVSAEVSIRVFNVEVGPSRLWVTNWFYPLAEKGLAGMDIAQLRPYARNMAEHRTNCVRLPILELTKFSAGAQGELKFDFSDFDKVVTLFIEEGVIGRIEGGHIGWRSGGWTSQWLIEIRKINNGAVESARVDPSSQDADKFYGQFLPALVSHLKEKGWLDIYIQHQADECVPENSQSYKAIGALVHKYAPELPRIDTVLLREEVVGAVDIWVPRLDRLPHDYDFYKERQRAGEEVWLYTAVWPQGEWANRFIELPLLKTRILHWMNYRYGITGYLHWGYNYWKFNGITDPFTQLTPPHGVSILPAGDAWIVYPGPGKKPFDSMRHEAMRDGIADYELLSMLNERDSKAAQTLVAKHVLGWAEYDIDVKKFRETRLELLNLLQETTPVNFSARATKDFDVSVTPSKEDGRFVVLPVENPRYRGNELFRAFENYYSPRVRELRNRYGLDAVVAGETDEWKRILLLRHWIKSNIAIDNNNPTQTRGDTFAILDAALKGGKFHCTHFSIVQHAVLNSFGYVTRRLGCGPGLKDDGGHHGVNEVWVNKFSKWVLIDAKYDAHFEKNGVALSALEIRDEVWRDGAQSTICVVGPDRRPMKPDSETGKSETRPDTYRWCSWETSTNRFTTFPATSTSTLVMLGDEIFKKNTWYRDGKPHWAYDTPYMILTSRRDWIEWTPNVITSKVTIEDGKARVFLSSRTPNFRSFQTKAGDDTWRDCSEEVERALVKKDHNRFTFRTINLFGTTGPEHRVEIVYSLDRSDQP